MDTKLTFIFINGKPGVGKDTQADKLLEVLPESMKISTGDFYRDAKPGSTGKYSYFREILAPYVDSIDKGGFIPDDKVLECVQIELAKEIGLGKRTFVFTGFPRTVPQLLLLDKMLKELRDSYIIDDKHILYALPDEISDQRAEVRRGEALAQGKEPRADDTKPTRERRLSAYKNLTLPMLEVLSTEGRLIVVRANRDKETVLENTLSLLRRERSN